MSGDNINPVPRYVMIKNYLLDQIESGEIQPEDKTESENELSKRFSVSRLTVQRAVRELVATGVLNRRQGSGTYVAARQTRYSLFEVKDLAEEMTLRGNEASARVLIQRKIIPDQSVCVLMDLNPDEAVFHAKILRRSDGTPVAIEDRYARCNVFKNFLSKDFETYSIHDYFARHTKLETVETNLKAISTDDILSSRLEISQNEPCLFLERRNWFEKQVVTLTRITFAGTRFSLGSRYNVD